MADVGDRTHGMVSAFTAVGSQETEKMLFSPGRFYAAAGIKQIVSLILTKYDCEIIDREAPRKFSWRTCNVPRSDLPIVLRPRSTKPE